MNIGAEYLKIVIERFKSIKNLGDKAIKIFIGHSMKNPIVLL